MGRTCRALGTRCASPPWPLAPERLSRLRERRPRDLALHSEAAPCSAGPRGGGARLEQGMVCRPCWSPCAGMAGLTLIAQRPQRRGEQHRAWASLVACRRPALAGPAGYRSRQMSRPIDFPMGSRSLPMGAADPCQWAADPSAATVPLFIRGNANERGRRPTPGQVAKTTIIRVFLYLMAIVARSAPKAPNT